jgi:glycolate oxidase iron-sulfur subunit
MRSVAWENAPIDQSFVHFMDTCVQCRGCEPACPSGVPYGRLIESTRATLATRTTPASRLMKLGLRVLGHHRLLLAGSTLIAIAQRLKFVPKRLGLTRIALRRGAALQSTGSDAWLFTGCVMDAWQRDTHRATQRVVAAAGVECAVAGTGGACCGALQAHAGLTDLAIKRAQHTIDSMPGEAPILVNSAGCGAAMKEYGHLLGTAQAAAFSKRVFDIHEFLATRLADMPDLPAGTERRTVIVQDPCHLRHVQKAHLPVRQVLAKYAEIVELDDDGLCCGAGGSYSVQQPELATQIRDRKLASIAKARHASGATVVASANPGCSMHLNAGLAGGAPAGGALTVCHPMDIVAEAIGQRP